jgi:esterase/lipase
MIMKKCFTLFTLILLSCGDPDLPENYGKVVTELYLGDGENQPLIVGLGGSEGGNAWTGDRWKPTRDKFLSQGSAFLALGYFGGNGTPETLDRISIDAVHEAIIAASKNEKINNKKIAIIGGSKGAELALLMSSHYDDITCVVAMVPGLAAFPALTMSASTSSWTYQNKEVPFVPVPWSATSDLITHDLRSAFTKMLKDTVAVNAAAIQIEKINGPILFVSATRDEMWPSAEMSVDMLKRLDSMNFKFPHEHIEVDGGHSDVFDHFDEVIEFLMKNL